VTHHGHFVESGLTIEDDGIAVIDVTLDDIADFQMLKKKED
jgi:hypothetical protein